MMDRFYAQTAADEFLTDTRANGPPTTDRRLPAQQISTGDPQDAPFSQLPIAPRTEHQAKITCPPLLPRDLSFKVVPVAFPNRPADNLHERFCPEKAKIGQSQLINDTPGAHSRAPTNDGVRIKYYGAYLKPAERRGPHIIGRQHTYLCDDIAPASSYSNAPMNPTLSGGQQYGFSRSSISYPSSASISSHSLTCSSLASSDPPSDGLSSPIVESPSTTVSVDEDSVDKKDGPESEESDNETCIFEDANSTMTYECSILSQLKELKKGADNASASQSPSTPSSTASFNDATRKVASQNVVQHTAIDQSSRQDSQTINREPEEPTGPAAGRFIADYAEQCYPPPQPRARPESLDIRIPGRYVSIYEDSSLEESWKLPDKSNGIGEGVDNDSPDSNIHGGSMSSPGSFLIDLLNQWQKIPTTADVPLLFVKQLKRAIEVFENRKLDGSDHTPSELVDEVSSTQTSSSDSHDPPDSHQSSSSGPCANSSQSSHSYQTTNLSSHWTPFSERSRIPASRQLGSNTKLQIQHHRAWLAATPTLEINDNCLPSTHLPSIRTPNNENEESYRYLDSSTAVNDSSYRRKNLNVFFGAKVANGTQITSNPEPLDLQLSQSWRRSHGKMSIAAELTRTVRGGLKSLKLSALQDHKLDLGPSHESHGDLHLSDGERSSIRHMPGHLPEGTGRRSLSCGPLGRSRSGSHQLLEHPSPPSSSSSSKKTLRVRFQES